jgi:FAD/FMN-containing dehydrogenase
MTQPDPKTMATRRRMPAEQRLGSDQFLSGLAALLDGQGLLRDPALLERHACDWTGKEPCQPIAVARPRTTAEVSAVLRHCHAHGWPVVVQGGLTGLVGGATPRPGELALSLERLVGIDSLDATGSVMVAGAGTTLAAVHDAASSEGLCFPLDLPSRGSCTIGGNIATNAGGNRVLRYGMTRSLVLGLEAVLADGTVLSSMSAVMKDNAGYDLKQLFIGTEGTLGVVTRAALRLHPEPAERLTLLVASPSYPQLLALLRTLRRRLGPKLSAFEAMWDSYLESVLTATGAARPFAARHPLYALIEVELLDPVADREATESAVAAAHSRGEVSDAIVASSGMEAARLWHLREYAGELLGKCAAAGAHDISLPIEGMEAYAAAVRQRCTAELGVRQLCVFGHLGDGNLHLLTLLRSADDAEALDAIVYGALPAGGSVSAEHGIGTAKKRWLGVSRSAAEILVMRGLKQHLDPRGILNPGRVI